MADSCTMNTLEAIRMMNRNTAYNNQAQPAVGGFNGAQGYPQSLFDGQDYGCPDDCVGNHMYGFILSNVAAGATPIGGATAVPQVRNQPRRLFLTETVADNFLINNIEVGIVNLLGTAGSISAAVFIPNAICPDFKRVTCDVAQTITILVTNQSGAAATFAATMSAYLLR